MKIFETNCCFGILDKDGTKKQDLQKYMQCISTYNIDEVNQFKDERIIVGLWYKVLQFIQPFQSIIGVLSQVISFVFDVLLTIIIVFSFCLNSHFVKSKYNKCQYCLFLVTTSLHFFKNKITLKIILSHGSNTSFCQRCQML